MNNNLQKFCLYCFETNIDKISKAHVFPESIGGRIKIPYTCKKCNSIIGSEIESKIKKCLFFVFGIDQLNIQSKDKAYKNIKIQEDSTRGELYYKNNKLLGKSKVLDEQDIIRGTKEYVYEQRLKWIEENRPNWVEYFKNEVAKGSEKINIAGDIFKVTNFKKKSKTVFTGNVRFPTDLLAKLAYELMFGFGFPHPDLIHQFYQSSFIIKRNKGNIYDIKVNKLFYKRISSINAPRILDDEKIIPTLKYQPFHGVVFRVSKNGIAYLRIIFFGVLSFLIVIGKTELDKVKNEILNIRYIFPVNSHQLESIPEDNKIEIITRDHLAAETLWAVYSKSI